MIAFLPLPGGHIKLAERFVDPAFSFTMGWNYWYNWTLVLPAEISAAAVLVNYWNKDVNDAAWITICILVVISINMCGAGVYGEAEFIFAYLSFCYFHSVRSLTTCPTDQSKSLPSQVRVTTYSSVE